MQKYFRLITLGLCAALSLQVSAIVGDRPAASNEALAILTTNTLYENSNSMGAYVALRRTERPVIIVTEDRTFTNEETQLNTGWAEGLDLTLPKTLETSSDRANAIRSWLLTNYEAMNITYLLLVGNPNPDGGEVPMKNFWPNKGIEDYALINPEVMSSAQWFCETFAEETDEVAGEKDAALNAKKIANGKKGDVGSGDELPAYEDCLTWKPDHHYDRSIPSDYFYSNLSYSWPTDEDGDIVNILNMSMAEQDVHVGRVPIYNNDTASLDRILNKFIAYSTATDISWRKSALLAMNRHFADKPGDYVPWGEAMVNRILTPNAFEVFRIYDTYIPDGCTEPACQTAGDLTLSFENMGSAWAGSAWSGCVGEICNQPKHDFGVVAWAAHGNVAYAENVFDVWDPNGAYNYVSALDDQHPAFAGGLACNNSMPYYQQNAGTQLLDNGVIGHVGASTISWPGYADWANPYVNTAGSTDVLFGFFAELIDNNLTAGAALSQMRTTLWNDVLSTMNKPGILTDFAAWNWAVGWLAQPMLFNLYGDPTIGLDSGGMPAGVIDLPITAPVSVTVSAGQATSLFADKWPSQDNPWWNANVIIQLTATDGQPIPVGTLWVNGVAYDIGGENVWYEEEIDVPDTGPYTIDIVTTQNTELMVTLNSK